MKRRSLLFTLSMAAVLAACNAFAQDSGELVAAEVPPPQSAGFFTVVASGGPLGLLNWVGIFLWAILGIPLGILSIVHCTTSRVRQWPLATKLLVIGGIWLLVLGWGGVAQSTISAFSNIASGPANAGLLALDISQAVYSIARALAVCQCYLFFLLISIVIIHFKHRKLLDDACRP